MGRLTTLGLRLTPLDTRRVKPAPKTVEPFYVSPQYRVWREQVVRRTQGRCQECRREASRLFADHVVEVKDGGARFDPANGLARCGSCHTRKTASERVKRLQCRK
jgi:5-methylcytosine-specific restriction protein A